MQTVSAVALYAQGFPENPAMIDLTRGKSSNAGTPACSSGCTSSLSRSRRKRAT